MVYMDENGLKNKHGENRVEEYLKKILKRGLA
jgi:hypothetical protein